jgi:bacteriorhodopsin
MNSNPFPVPLPSGLHPPKPLTTPTPPMSIDSTLSKANKAPFSVVGAVCAAFGCIFIFHSSIQDNAFKYGFGSIATGAQLIALGTLLQHTKQLSQK